MSFLSTIQRIGDIGLDIAKGVGAVVAPFNPLLGAAIGGGALLVDRVTDWERAPTEGLAAPQALMSGGMAPAAPTLLPSTVSQNIPGGGLLSSALGTIFPTGFPGTVAPGTTSGPGLLPRGPGGALQMPWNDPRIPAFLKQFAIDDGYLRSVPRAPRGYVVLRDAQGRPFGVLKQVARAFRLWKAKQKPPISVKQWNALKRANSTIRTMQKINKMAKTLGNKRKLLAA